MDYRPSGICSRNIHVELDGNIIKNVVFTGGCPGNTSGIARLVIGMDAKEAINRLRGIRCGTRATSCPDQLSIALSKALQ